MCAAWPLLSFQSSSHAGVKAKSLGQPWIPIRLSVYRPGRRVRTGSGIHTQFRQWFIIGDPGHTKATRDPSVPSRPNKPPCWRRFACNSLRPQASARGMLHRAVILTYPQGRCWPEHCRALYFFEGRLCMGRPDPIIGGHGPPHVALGIAARFVW